ncbi:hypothetical protein JKI95_07755 [Corynebacterium aquatimens]|uniref:hypothetical protein n=1 Tax=Corynebacterium TaxID=1716 RepID=UPI001F157AC1|nr:MULTISPECIES: hypothetical protein [Corynebacterium]QYH19133.1 hypothetical protein JKI95_07755 [Corynebacterium aquatimens]UIZ91995.1 hypothetical protein JZY91_10010 [Corynebacterium sp. CNCTC7651]
MWAPATLDNLTGQTLTFLVDSTPVVRTFPSSEAVVEFMCTAGTQFEFNAADNSVRSVAGVVINLPELAAPQHFVPHTKCRLVTGGHNVHHLPVLRAVNDRATLWLPVDILEVDGQKVVFGTPEGVTTGYSHDPERFARMREYSPKWRVLRGAASDHELGGTTREFCNFAAQPIGPCVG